MRLARFVPAFLRHGMHGRVWVAGGLVIVGMSIFQVYDVLRRLEIVVDDAQRELRMTSRALAEHAAQTLTGADMVLRELASAPGSRELRSDPKLRERLLDRARGLPQLRELAIVRSDGSVRMDTRGEVPSAAPAAVAGEVGRRSADLRISPAFALPGDHRWTVAMMRSVAGAASAGDALVVGYLDLDYFSRAYAGLELTTGSRVSLLDHIGHALVSRTIAAADGGTGQAEQKVFAALLAKVHDPDGAAQDPGDGEERIYAVHAVPGFPLAIGVSAQKSMVLAPWYVQATHSAARTTLLCVSVALLMALVLRQLRKRELAEQHLRVQTASLDELFDSAPEAIAMLDLRGRVVRVNREFTRLFGYAADEAQGHSLEELIVPEHLTAESLRMARIVGEGQHASTETTRRRKDGSRLFVSALSAPIVLATGQIASYAIYRDITERRQAEEERGKLEGRLRQAEKLEALGRMAGGIAHDFNSVLSAILGYGNLALASTQDGSAGNRYLASVLSAADRGRGLVDQILTYSRSTRGHRSLVDVRELVEEALDLVRASLPADVGLRIRVSAKGLSIMADPTHVHQLVMNLCSNAIRAMPAGGTLDVALDEHVTDASAELSHGTLAPATYVRLAVRDTGTGMAPAVVERIFEPFFTTGRQGAGTGLGLALVHGIVADLGGAIDVRTAPDAGSTFTLYLPASPAQALERAHDDVTLARGHGERVLLVEDERPLMLLGEEMLAALNYEPAGFTRAADALAELAADPTRFDVAMIDQLMPEVTGIEFTKRLRAVRGDLPIVLLAREAGPFLMQEALAAGVDAVLAKPLELHEVAIAMAKVLTGSRAKLPSH